MASHKVTQRSDGRPYRVQDWHLSRFAAYLVAMNGDPRKPEIAAAQTYFAVKTREAETRPVAAEKPLGEWETAGLRRTTRSRTGWSSTPRPPQRRLSLLSRLWPLGRFIEPQPQGPGVSANADPSSDLRQGIGSHPKPDLMAFIDVLLVVAPNRGSSMPAAPGKSSP